MKVVSVKIDKNFTKVVELDNGKIFRVALVDNFNVGDEVKIFTNVYGSSSNPVYCDGIKNV